MTTDVFELTHNGEEPAPLIYISVPLTALDRGQRMESKMWEVAVSEAVLDAAALHEELWSPRHYSGLDFVSRLNPDSEEAAADVFHLNSNACWSYADALIAVVVRGGSTGVGVEIAWAINLGIPILYIHPPGERVSRLIRGMREEAGIEIAQAGKPTDAFDVVTRFLVKHRNVIEDHRRRREAWEHQTEPLREILANHWRELVLEEDERETAAIAKIAPARIKHLLGDQAAFANASLREIHALAGALGVHLALRPALNAEERRALSEAARRLTLTPSDVLELQAAGKAAVALTETAGEFDLTDPDTWVSIAQAALAS